MNDKNWFDNDPMLQYVLKNFDISSAESYKKSSDEIYQKLRDKPILTGTELMVLPSQPDNYIIQGLVWKGDVVIVLASEKAGKTILGLQMACSLTAGGHFLGEYEVPDACKVLYIQAEGSREETTLRLKAMNQEGALEWNPANFYHMFPSSISLDTQEGYDHVVDCIYKTEFHPDVIFIDPLYMAMQGDLIDNKASRLFCRNIRKLKELFNATIIINHHKRRPQKDKNGKYMDSGDDEIMGSFVWKAFPSHILTLHKKSNNLRTLNCTTQRSGNVISNLVLELVEPDPLYFKINYEKNKKSVVTEVYTYLLQEKEPKSVEMLATELKLDSGCIRRAIANLLAIKPPKIVNQNKGKRPSMYVTTEGVKNGI
jgi:RecA-family ATPase